MKQSMNMIQKNNTKFKINKTENKESILKILTNINRPNTTLLIDYLETYNFFEAPASSKYHLNVSGGLAEHSFNVFRIFHNLCYTYSYNTKNISEESITISSLLHDLCKVHLYILKNGIYEYNENCPVGHSTLTLSILNNIQYPLTEQEQNLIKYHMGVYSTTEFNIKKSEYTIQNWTDAISVDPYVYLFHTADMIASKFKEDNY